MSRAHPFTGEISIKPCRRQVTINALPNDVLLEIFDFSLGVGRGNAWQTLVHVCQKWRIIVFTEPRRLNLELNCTDGIPVRNTLHIWPPLPINLSYDCYGSSGRCNYKFGDNVDNIIAALELKDRVCKVILSNAPSSEMEEISTAMLEPFPELIVLKLTPEHGFVQAPVVRVPDSFLGGSAPRLQELFLDRILLPFLGLQKLLLSASGLNRLLLRDISDSVYFSPDEIVSCLSTLTRLKELELTFQSPRSRPVRESRHPPPPTHILLPALTKLTFQGVNEYLEDLVAQIDAPQLQTLSITFFHQLFFHTPQLSRFISRGPKLKGYDEACVVFTHRSAWVTLRMSLRPLYTHDEEIRVAISCRHPDLQLLSLAQVCTPSFHHTFIPAVRHLIITESKEYEEEEWEADLEGLRNNVQNGQWLQLLQPFIAVKDLYISEKIVPLIAPALRELVGWRVTEALPALECLFLDGLRASGPVRDAIVPFVSARQLSTHPITVSHSDPEFDHWWEGDEWS